MADRLTQLQDCLDQLATQFYASLRYITTHHPSAPIPTQPTHDLSPPSPTITSALTATAAADPDADNQNQPSSQNPNLNTDPGYRPADPVAFNAALHELAHDLVLKEQQIEYLIGVLPGIEKSEQEQEERIKVLAAELREVEKERREIVGEKEELVERLDRVIAGVRRV
ncbi:RNA polymerase II mediator complex subunit [Lignoscripta atroalba]|nr:RNA polymerase II mediator complex subunit [Lignoscripta atroalba]